MSTVSGKENYFSGHFQGIQIVQSGIIIKFGTYSKCYLIQWLWWEERGCCIVLLWLVAVWASLGLSELVRCLLIFLTHDCVCCSSETCLPFHWESHMPFLSCWQVSFLLSAYLQLLWLLNIQLCIFFMIRSPQFFRCPVWIGPPVECN